MLLADAIEAWGQAHRAQLDPAAIDKLRKMWATIKRSTAAEFDFDQMTKEDARAVMALFPQEQRKDVSDLLNSIRRWTLQQGQVQQGQVQQGEEPAPIVNLQPVATPADPPAAAVAMPVATIAPRGSQHHQGHGGVPQGPVEPLVAPRTALEGDKPTSSRAVLIGLGLALLVLLAYFLFFRGDDETDVTTSNGEGTELDQAANDAAGQEATGEPAISFGGDDDADSFTGQGGGDFCSLAEQVEDSDDFESVGVPDAAYFDNIMSLWGQVTAIAPPELASDVAVMQRALSAYSEAAASVDFNMADPGMVEAFQAMDTAAFETASNNFERYLSDVCGIDTGSDLDSGGADAITGLNVPNQDGQSSLTEAEGLQILQTFGITPELAQCLNAEFADVDSAMFDPDLFSKPVCGTTLLEVMSGLSG